MRAEAFVPVQPVRWRDYVSPLDSFPTQEMSEGGQKAMRMWFDTRSKIRHSMELLEESIALHNDVMRDCVAIKQQIAIEAEVRRRTAHALQRLSASAAQHAVEQPELAYSVAQSSPQAQPAAYWMAQQALAAAHVAPQDVTPVRATAPPRPVTPPATPSLPPPTLTSPSPKGVAAMLARVLSHSAPNPFATGDHLAFSAGTPGTFHSAVTTPPQPLMAETSPANRWLPQYALPASPSTGVGNGRGSSLSPVEKETDVSPPPPANPNSRAWVPVEVPKIKSDLGDQTFQTLAARRASVINVSSDPSPAPTTTPSAQPSSFAHSTPSIAVTAASFVDPQPGAGVTMNDSLGQSRLMQESTAAFADDDTVYHQYKPKPRITAPATPHNTNNNNDVHHVELSPMTPAPSYPPLTKDEAVKALGQQMPASMLGLSALEDDAHSPVENTVSSAANAVMAAVSQAISRVVSPAASRSQSPVDAGRQSSSAGTLQRKSSSLHQDPSPPQPSALTAGALATLPPAPLSRSRAASVVSVPAPDPGVVSTLAAVVGALGRPTPSVSRAPTPPSVRSSADSPAHRPTSPLASPTSMDGSPIEPTLTLSDARRQATLFDILLRLRRKPSFFRAWKRRHVCLVGNWLLLYRENAVMTDTPAEACDVVHYKGEVATEDIHGQKHVLFLRPTKPDAETVVLGCVNDAEEVKWAKAIKAAQKVAEMKATASKAVASALGPKTPQLPPGYTRQAPDIDTMTTDQMLRRITEAITFFEPNRVSSLIKMQPLLKGRERDVLAQTYKRHGGPPPSYHNRVTVFCKKFSVSDVETENWLAKLNATRPGAEYDDVIKPLIAQYNGGKEY